MLMSVLLKEIELHFSKTLSVEPVPGNLIVRRVVVSLGIGI